MLEQMGIAAKAASYKLAQLSSREKNQVLEKLGLVPDQAERAKKAVEQVNTQKKLTGLADTLAGDLKAVTAQSKKEETSRFMARSESRWM